MDSRIHPNPPRLAVIAVPIAAACLALAASGCGGSGGGSHAASASAAPKAALGISTQTPAEGQQVSGSISWQVTVTGAPASRVDFAIDGTVMWTQRTSPYLYGGKTGGLDTTRLPNGSHTLSATAYGSKGLKPATTRVTVTVANNAPPSASRAYWGAWIGDQLTGGAPPWDMTAVSKFEQMTGKPLSLLEFAVPFANCSTSPCSYYSFPWTPFNDIRAHGAIPFLSWSSQSIPSSTNEPDFQLADVANGKYDSYIRSFATRAREWGHPFFLRFDWEMNGNWFPWSERTNGNAAGQYVAAWRHVHDIFKSVGATDANWVWCPFADPNGTLQSLASLYPGDAYVDWTCLDGYNWGTNPISPRVWRSFEFLFKPSYREITETLAPSKPLVVGETASSEYGGSKAGWIHNMFSSLATELPKIRGLIWFEKNEGGMDWPIESSETSLSSFANGIQDPRYAPNEFGSLSTSPIPPP